MSLGATRDDLLRVVAALFQRLGGEAAGIVDLRNALTFDLAWFTPTEAKLVLRAAEREGLLRPEGDGFRPGFDPQGLALPTGYRPPKALVEWSRRVPEADPAPAAARPDDAEEAEAAPPRRAPPAGRGAAPPANRGADGPSAPPGAAPGAAPSADPTVPLLERFIHRIARSTGETETLVRDRVTLQHRVLGESVTAETAAMLVGLGLGVDVGDLVQELEVRLRAA